MQNAPTTESAVCRFHNKTHPEGFLCLFEAAEYLNVGLTTFRQIWLKDTECRKLLNPHRIHYRLTLFKKKDLDRFLATMCLPDQPMPDTPDKSVTRRIERGNGKSHRDSHGNS